MINYIGWWVTVLAEAEYLLSFLSNGGRRAESHTMANFLGKANQVRLLGSGFWWWWHDFCSASVNKERLGGCVREERYEIWKVWQVNFSFPCLVVTRNGSHFAPFCSRKGVEKFQLCLSFVCFLEVTFISMDFLKLFHSWRVEIWGFSLYYPFGLFCLKQNNRNGDFRAGKIQFVLMPFFFLLYLWNW